MVTEETRPRPRDPVTERRERDGYRILERVYVRAAGRCSIPVDAIRVATELGLSTEDALRGIEHLTRRNHLAYAGVGSRVCLTRSGVDYVEWAAGRRRSVR